MGTDRSVKVIWFNLITLTNGTWNQKLSVYIAHANKRKMPKSTPAHFLFPNKPLFFFFFEIIPNKPLYVGC